MAWHDDDFGEADREDREIHAQLDELEAFEAQPSRAAAALRADVHRALSALACEVVKAEDLLEDGFPATAPIDDITLDDLIGRFESIAGAWNRARRRGVAALIERAGTPHGFAPAAVLIHLAWTEALDALDALGDRSPPPDRVPSPPAADPVAALTAAPAAPPR